jgi:hypothetical protein
MSHEPENASINEPPGSNLGAPVAPPPAPVIEALDPDEVELGTADLVMHVHGTGFAADSVVSFDGADAATTFVSETEVTAGVSPAAYDVAGVVPVLVRTGEQSSEVVEFEFLDPVAPLASKRTQPKKSKKK